MVAVQKYLLVEGSTRYKVRYHTPERRQTDKRGFRTKRDAESFAATLAGSMADGSYVAPAAGRMSIGDLYSTWSEQRTRVKAIDSGQKYEPLALSR